MKDDLNELQTADPKILSSLSTGKHLGKDEDHIQAIQTAWSFLKPKCGFIVKFGGLTMTSSTCMSSCTTKWFLQV